MTLRDRTVAYAISQGADLVGVSNPRKYGEYLDQVRERLAETRASANDFMLSMDTATFFDTLSDARHTLSGANSIIILGVYALDHENDDKETRRKLQGKIARTYAYYPVIRQIAEQVTEYIRQAGYTAVCGQQVPLKYVSQDIGLGSYGWNGLFLTKKFGSYVALRAIITDADLEPDSFTSPMMPCEDCGRCLRACPTGALYAPYKVNPTLCINPMTRKEDAIPRELQEKMGNWVCGCDICQEVCPVNRTLEPRVPDPRAGFDPLHHASHRSLAGLKRNPDLRNLIKHSNEFVMRRNAIIAIGNIAGKEGLCFLRTCSENEPGDLLAEYLESAINRIAQKTK